MREAKLTIRNKEKEFFTINWVIFCIQGSENKTNFMD